MSREFYEETGVHTSPEQWACYCVINRPDKYTVNFLVSIDNNVLIQETLKRKLWEYMKLIIYLTIPLIIYAGLYQCQ
ncbi:hypothetical protein M5J15_03465 [Serratia symbiotica]|nr:hypothetical protein [Serratia symbiotica]USS96738.1 hypothetical protein M5J15_03465 [Serratia symbiotica]